MTCSACTRKGKTCQGCIQVYRRQNKLCLKCGEATIKGVLCEVHRLENNSRNRTSYDPVLKKEYYHKNKPAILKAHAKYVKEKYKTDVQFRLRRNILSRIQDIMKTVDGTKKFSISKNLGCTFEELKQHLEDEFYQHPETFEYMSWDNYGVSGWHIDHILPLSIFNLEDPLQFQMANHYTNLRPAWAEQNIKKSDVLDSDSYLHTIRLEDGFYVIESDEEELS